MYPLSIHCSLFTDLSDFDTSLATLPAVLHFLPNEASKIFSVWSVQDNVTEGTECFAFLLEPVDELVEITAGNENVTICIEDDDSEFVMIMVRSSYNSLLLKMQNTYTFVACFKLI